MHVTRSDSNVFHRLSGSPIIGTPEKRRNLQSLLPFAYLFCESPDLQVPLRLTRSDAESLGNTRESNGCRSPASSKMSRVGCFGSAIRSPRATQADESSALEVSATFISILKPGAQARCRGRFIS